MLIQYVESDRFQKIKDRLYGLSVTKLISLVDLKESLGGLDMYFDSIHMLVQKLAESSQILAMDIAITCLNYNWSEDKLLDFLQNDIGNPLILDNLALDLGYKGQLGSTLNSSIYIAETLCFDLGVGSLND